MARHIRPPHLPVSELFEERGIPQYSTIGSITMQCHVSKWPCILSLALQGYFYLSV